MIYFFDNNPTFGGKLSITIDSRLLHKMEVLCCMCVFKEEYKIIKATPCINRTKIHQVLCLFHRGMKKVIL